MLTTQRSRRKRRIRGRLMGTSERPRVSIYRSNKHIYAQVVDDEKGKTLSAISDKEIKEKGTPMEISKKLGEELAKKVLKLKIKEIVFDRSGYRYHGRVKAVADGMRSEGVQF